ncbi:disease resistance protein Pik-1-like, partial [Telopea speciosissima]|uniref:disease resistance protein Pik-1-like n=1 Tax=Telopea speciosissima TaxID=54955 RepID=UPI001CC48D37
MKQKVVMKVEMSCQKCRTKVLKIAASSVGVEEVKLEGDEKDKVVVIGENVDSIRLAKCLRKKVGHTQILTLDEVKKSDDEKKEKEK